eukprot:3024255-Pleurochrysis_carterae.AAC.1
MSVVVLHAERNAAADCGSPIGASRSSSGVCGLLGRAGGGARAGGHVSPQRSGQSRAEPHDPRAGGGLRREDTRFHRASPEGRN